MVVGELRARRCGLQPFIEATPSVCCSLQQISSKIARVGCSRSTARGDRRTGLAELPAPQFRLFYHVEIRHHQIPSSKIPNPLTAADARDSTTRLWQLWDRYVEIAGLAAAFG
jgi:hypothetical protein